LIGPEHKGVLDPPKSSYRTRRFYTQKAIRLKFFSSQSRYEYLSPSGKMLVGLSSDFVGRFSLISSLQIPYRSNEHAF
jgi:hypothetical protein